MPEYLIPHPPFFDAPITAHGPVQVQCVCIHCGARFWALASHIPPCPFCGLWGGY